MILLRFILSCYIVQLCLADDSNDKFWILFDHTNLYDCKGSVNQMNFTKDDVSIVDKNGKLALYLECPNEYSIVINNIKVQKPLPNLNGNLAATLQIPLVQGPAGMSLDYPYQVIPQKVIMQGSRCDNESGVITANNREYCRYCELCETVGHTEEKVGPEQKFGHQYITVDRGDTFGKRCKQIDPKTYTIKKSINVPGKKEIQDSVNQNVKGKLDQQLEKKLKVGKGKFDVYLEVYTSNTPADPSNSWYPNHKGCECCIKDDKGSSNCQLNLWNKMAGSFAGGVFAGDPNVCPKCNNEYVKTCLKGTQDRVACYTVEFHYRVTDKESDVEQFKQEIDYNRKSQSNTYTNVEAKSGPQTSGVIAGGNNNTGSVVMGPEKPTTIADNAANTGGGGGPTPCNTCSKEACVNSISVPATKNYCSKWWDTTNAKRYCCGKCRSVCSA